jgi:hypothetical protein
MSIQRWNFGAVSGIGRSEDFSRKKVLTQGNHARPTMA